MSTSLAEVDHDRRWRPRNRKGRICGYVHGPVVCGRRGAHYCEPRADRVVVWFARYLQHTRGVYARTAFRLADWQEHEVIRPLFGEVEWSPELGGYLRRYRVAYMVMARKNGKSELAAAIQLYMLLGDGEEAAEVYSAAKDTKQAGMVFEPAERMIRLNPALQRQSGRQVTVVNKHARRIIAPRSGSYYEILTSDAAGELGRNPHSFNLDEVLAMPNASLWNAMRGAVGARAQPLMFATTTETSDSSSFGAILIDEAERIVEDPARSPHIFAFVRKLPTTAEGVARLRRLHPGHPHLPVSTDWLDEANWQWPNPALGDFKSIGAMREQAIEARQSVTAENAFRQFHVNQRVQQVTRYLSLELWDACTGDVMATPGWWDARLAGRRCWAGLDLSSKLDMTAWCLVFEDGATTWRFWIPEAVVPELSAATGGRFEAWVRDGWITATEGDTIDYEAVHAAINADAGRYVIESLTYDRWSGEPVRQRIAADTGLDPIESGTTYTNMTAPMTEALRLLTAGEMSHGGNPVARWMADNLQAKRPRDDPDRVRPVKPDRGASTVRIDGMPAWFLALAGKLSTRPEPVSAYEDPNARVEVL